MILAIINSDENSENNLNKSLDDKSHSDIKTKIFIKKTILLTKDKNLKKIFYIANGSQFNLNKVLSEIYFKIPFYNFECSSPSSIQNLLLLAPYIKNESICLINGDLPHSKASFDDFITFSSLQKDIDGVIAMKKNSLNDNQMGVALNDEGYIIKLGNSNIGYNWTTASLYYFYPNILDKIELALDLGISRFDSFLRFLINQNYLLKGF